MKSNNYVSNEIICLNFFIVILCILCLWGYFSLNIKFREMKANYINIVDLFCVNKNLEDECQKSLYHMKRRENTIDTRKISNNTTLVRDI